MVPALGVVGGTPGWAVRRIIAGRRRLRCTTAPCSLLLLDRLSSSYMPITYPITSS